MSRISVVNLVEEILPQSGENMALESSWVLEARKTKSRAQSSLWHKEDEGPGPCFLILLLDFVYCFQLINFPPQK